MQWSQFTFQLFPLRQQLSTIVSMFENRYHHSTQHWRLCHCRMWPFWRLSEKRRCLVWCVCSTWNCECCSKCIFFFSLVTDPRYATNLREFNNSNANRLKYSSWLTISNQIIDVCIAFAKFDIPAYVLLEIVDWLPYFECVERKKKIDLIINVKKTIEKVVSMKEAVEYLENLVFDWDLK